MPMDKTIQDKVLKIAGNKAVNNKVKLAVRKQFYILKGEELDLEAAQEEFNAKTTQFSAELDSILVAMKNIPDVAVVDTVVDEKLDEDVVVEKKDTSLSNGLKVRMQEELEPTTEEATDFEVPFESEEQ